ncbi:MAG: TldD/PmbA family protein [Bacteroidales bacterium]|nr:TldD/PmbA family protein [Bacteroidales bacterium]
MITPSEIQAARRCITIALENGASASRVCLTKSVNDTCTMLNSELDKVTHSADRSVYIYLYVDGRYGTFSTNRLEEAELEAFIIKAIGMVRMLGEDLCRTLPDPSRTATDAKSGLELGLYDAAYEGTDADARLHTAESLSIYGSLAAGEDGFIETDGRRFRLISEECEYADSIDDIYTVDSQGFEGRHTETSFNCFTEMTIEDTEGNKYSSFWWEASPFIKDIHGQECSRTALQKAISQIGPKNRRSGLYRMVVDTAVASKLISPILSALNASSIQQKMSFLEDSIGKRMFPEGFTLMDYARTPGRTGARLFDTEGVATKDAPIIENGIVRQYFVNTYMANKMHIAPTVEDITRPCVLPYLRDEAIHSGSISRQDILRRCGNGILVTGFNGGNCNPTTGDFSFGVEGFAFRRGRITHPVREMLITGNLLTLWNSLLAAATDARPSTRWQIPTLAFDAVSFSA